MNNAQMSREKTTALLTAVEEGMTTWEAIARAALNYMSEYDVADMAECEGLLPPDEDTEEF